MTQTSSGSLVDAHAGWCSSCRVQRHAACKSLICVCPKPASKHPLRPPAQMRAKVVPIGRRTTAKIEREPIPPPPPTAHERGAAVVLARAETIAALIGAGLLASDERTLRKASEVAHVGLVPIRQALEREERRRRRVGSLPPEMRAANVARQKKKQPVEGMRLCSGKGSCGQLLPVEDFPVKNRATGQLKSLCRSCLAAYQRDRYVRIGETKVVLSVLSGDLCIGTPCAACGCEIREGDEIIADRFMHESCPGKVDADA